MNVVISIVSAILYFVMEDSVMKMGMMIAAAMGIIIAVSNAVHISGGNLLNDGCRLKSIKESSKAKKVFVMQTKITKALLEGKRLKDMPNEWFDFSVNSHVKNQMIIGHEVTSCRRLMEQMEFSTASNRIRWLLEKQDFLSMIHRRTLICDMIYLELVLQNREEVLMELLTEQQIKFMQQNKKSLPVIRTRYAYALIAKRDKEEAERYKKQFEKLIPVYPHKGEVECERSLMEFATAV